MIVASNKGKIRGGGGLKKEKKCVANCGWYLQVEGISNKMTQKHLLHICIPVKVSFF